MGDRVDTKGTKQLGSSLAEDLVEEFRRWLAARKGETLREHLELALRRHMDSPPPPLRAAVPPLPSMAPPPAPKRRRK